MMDLAKMREDRDYWRAEYTRVLTERDAALLQLEQTKASVLEEVSAKTRARAERDAALLQNREYKVALEQIASLAIEFSDCDQEKCPSGSLQRTAQRALAQKQVCDHQWTGSKMICTKCGLVEERYVYEAEPVIDKLTEKRNRERPHPIRCECPDCKRQYT